MERLIGWLERALGDPARLPAETDDGVRHWRHRVLDVTLAVGLFLGTLSVVPGVIRAAAEQNYVLLAADIGALALAAWVLLGRGLPYAFRAGLLVAAAFGVGLVQIVTSGLQSPGPLWLLAAPVLAAILFELKVAMAMVAAVVITLLTQAGLDAAGRLPLLAEEVGSPRWVEMATDLVLLALVVPLLIGVLLQGLKVSFERVRRVSRDLQEEQARLLNANRALEEEVARREQAEEEREWLALAMEQAEHGVAIVGLDGTIQHVNRSFERLLGRERAELVGGAFDAVGLVTDAEVATDIFGTLEGGSVWTGRFSARRDGGGWDAEASFSTVRDADGRPTHRLAVVRDVSREVALERQLQQAQKMEAIGTFAGGIAHDFNNLLVPILGTAELLESELEGEARAQLEDIVRSARRGKALIAQILAFSRGSARRDTTVPLGDVVDDSERLLRASLPADIGLEVDLRAPGFASVSDAEVQQVLMNLCTNAFHAMPDGGTLRVTVDEVDGREVDLTDGVAAAPPDPEQRYVRLTVADTGAGMDENTLERVFEPFFTTKAAGEGTGLGLAMVHGVTTSAGGALVIRSALDRGTTVEVLFPRAEGAGSSGARASEMPRGAGERVLVVDDEAPVRLVAGRLLERLGYDPVSVAPGEARRILESADAVDLLVTDLSMPQMDGLELGRIARDARPGLPMILSTGLVDQNTLDRAREAGFDRVLAKPFDMDELARVVERTLSARTAGDKDPATAG